MLSKLPKEEGEMSEKESRKEKLKLFAGRIKVMSGVPNEADEMIMVHLRLQRAKKGARCLGLGAL